MPADCEASFSTGPRKLDTRMLAQHREVVVNDRNSKEATKYTDITTNFSNTTQIGVSVKQRIKEMGQKQRTKRGNE